MRRRLLILAGTAFLFAVLASAATAKGPIQFCGVGSCTTFAEEGAQAMSQLTGSSAEPESIPLQPYYVFRFGDLGGPLGYWVPGLGLLRWAQPPTRWHRPAPETAAAIAAAVAALEPLAPPRAADVFVDGGREVRRGAAFLQRLFTAGVRAPAPGSTRWLGVFVFGVSSPWTDGFSSVWISRRGAFLRRGGKTFRVAPGFAASVRDGTPLR